MPAKKNNPKRRLDNCLTKILDALPELTAANVSHHLVIHFEGHTQSYGTDHVKEVFERNKEDFEDALKNDALKLCSDKLDDEVAETENPGNSKGEVYKLRNGTGLTRLPLPLSLMNRREKVTYLRYLICHDRYLRLGEDSAKIKAGDKTWEARFWPNNFLKWSDLKINIGRVKKEDLGGECPTDFFTRVIKEALKMFKVDPEEFFDNMLDEKKLKARKKGMGIHDEPTVTAPVAANEQPGEFIRDQIEDRISEEQEEHSEAPPGSTNDVLPDDCSTESARVVPQHADVVRRPQDQGVPLYFDLPDYLKDLASAKKIRYNSGKGNCLCHAVAQQNNFDPTELRKYLNTKIVKDFVSLQEYITFPMRIRVGSGNQSYIKVINHQYEYFKFLRSDESIYAWNIGDMELIMLATIINQPIHVLMYNIQGLPVNTPLLDRCRLEAVYPKIDLVESNKFTMNEDIFLLYEDDVHYSLLDDKNEEIHEHTVIENEGNQTEGVTENNMYDWENPDNGEFIDNLYASFFLVRILVYH